MTDQDIDRWAADWRGNPPPIADLARMARRERRVIYAWIAMDWLVGAGLLAFAAWLWFDDGSPVMRFTAGGIAALTVAALAFATHNWRGSLAADRASAADFLAQAGRRSRARLRYVRFGWWVLAADLVVIAGAALIEFREEGPGRMLPMLAMAALATGAAAAALYGWGRREKRRAQRLSALTKAMQRDEEQ